jgi:hypothetical protein
MMSDVPRHSSRRRRPIQVEPLESRSLLSAAKASTPKYAGAETGLEIETSSDYVNQKEGSFTVTLNLKKFVILPGGREPDATLNAPLTIDFRASLLVQVSQI